MNMTQMKIIARIKTPFDTKFGIPRQSGVAAQVRGEIVFEPTYRDTDAVRGLEGYSHIWLIWCFSESVTDKWSPTVRPPRPNPIGLSCVELESIEYTRDRGAVLHVRGADLMDGTPIFDIKPYIPYADSHPEARGGFTDTVEFKKLSVIMPQGAEIPDGLQSVLENDPRPRYHDDESRVYGMQYAGYEVKFRVSGDTLTVLSVD